MLIIIDVNRPKDAKNSKLQFVTSAVNMQGCPKDALPEVAIIGRSNAGKSSMINGIANSKIALVSGTPGKTRLLNFYQAERYRLVDMPGYGFAARAGDEQKVWQAMIENYLAARQNLTGLLIIMDIRRDWAEEEENLVKWMSPRDLPVAIILTKSDKLSKGEAIARQRQIQKAAGTSAVFVTSYLKKEGYNDVEDFIYLEWIRPAQGNTGKKAQRDRKAQKNQQEALLEAVRESDPQASRDPEVEQEKIAKAGAKAGAKVAVRDMATDGGQKRDQKHNQKKKQQHKQAPKPASKSPSKSGAPKKSQKPSRKLPAAPKKKLTSKQLRQVKKNALAQKPSKK